jgi:alkylation response protein AidB-like acyl-CoA dehydrogenase
MRFAFTRDQELLRDAIRDVLKRECTPAVVRASWEERDAGDRLWRTLAELGVVGLTVPEEHGGLGLGALDWVLLAEECGRFAAPIALVDTMAVAVPLIAGSGKEDFQRRWLPAIAKGEARVALGLAGMPFVRDADRADLLLLQRGDEIHAVARADVTLVERASVDRSRRLFAIVGDGGPSLASGMAKEGLLATAEGVCAAFDRAALATSAELIGLAARMIEMTVEYAKVRNQFGAPIGSFQAVKHALASALVKLELARPAVYRAAHSVAHADPGVSLHVSIAKACASDAAALAARVSLQCHGAIGYSFEHDLHLWMKRAWALAAAHGDAAWHRARIARAVVDNVTRGDHP